MNSRVTEYWCCPSVEREKKKEVVKVVELQADQCPGRIGEWGVGRGGSEGLNGLYTGSSSGVSYGILMLLLGCVGMSSL